MTRTREEVEKDGDMADGDMGKFSIPTRLIALILEVLLDIRDKEK